MKIVPIPTQEGAKSTPDETKLEVGQWYWVKTTEKYYNEKDPDGTRKYLACVTHVGSNYAELDGATVGSDRIAFSIFDTVTEREHNPEQYIQNKIANCQKNVAQLMGRIQEVTASLGIVPREELDTQSQTSNALAVAHGTADIKAHKKALIKAKEETLPELFKKIQSWNESMTTWMKANLIPMEAQVKKLKDSTGVIEDRIFTVELYAGLVEELKQVKKGAAPKNPNEKTRIFQRQHFMDEECLYAYEAGGMEFRNICEFDEWLCRKDNLNRLLPFDRTIVSFRVRREEKEREFSSLKAFIQFTLSDVAKLDKKTFLYIRNGEQVYRLITEIDFGEQLFPDIDQSILLGNPSGHLWLHMEYTNSLKEVCSQRQYDAEMERRAKVDTEHDAAMKKYKVDRKAWDALSKEERKEDGRKEPREPWKYDNFRGAYEELTIDHLFYDDAMEKIQEATKKHNRVAVVLQGILDRSEALHPHPPWKIWTQEGFEAAFELIYDSSRALTGEAPPDFEEYRTQLNKSLKVGSITVGQQRRWEEHEAAIENAHRRRTSRYNDWDLTTYKPDGNPGPGRFARVTKMRRKGFCEFRWYRTMLRRDSIFEASEPILTVGKFLASKLLNVSAYNKGDFKMFYADPRTRADYIKWAPYLLAAEDYVCGKVRQLEEDEVPNIFDNDESDE